MNPVYLPPIKWPDPAVLRFVVCSTVYTVAFLGYAVSVLYVSPHSSLTSDACGSSGDRGEVGDAFPAARGEVGDSGFRGEVGGAFSSAAASTSSHALFDGFDFLLHVILFPLQAPRSTNSSGQPQKNSRPDTNTPRLWHRNCLP